MSSEAESTKSDDEDFSCGLLLRDIEEISRALYLHKSPHEALISSYNNRQNVVAKTGISESKIIEEPLHKDKRSSIWKWKPLKALTHIRNHRFNCCFFLHVHAIEGLPPDFNNLDLCVTWRRKADVLRTGPARVCFGMAEFEETLMHRCAVFVGRSGPHSSAKYESKPFLLQASVIGAPTLDIGSRWIDLSRLLPLTIEELEVDRNHSGKWTTCFNLTGKANGAILNVTFGYFVLNGTSFEPGYFVKVPDIVRENGLNDFADFDTSSRSKTTQLRSIGSILGSTSGASHSHSQSANSNSMKEIHPNQRSQLSKSVSSLYKIFNDGKMDNEMEFDLSHDAEYSGGRTGHEFDDIEFDVIDKGVEVSMKDQIQLGRTSQRFGNLTIETIDVAEIFTGEETEFEESSKWNSKLDADNHSCITEPSLRELDSEFYDLLTTRQEEMDTLTLDDVAIAESIENEFLNMLGLDQSQDNVVSSSSYGPPSDLLRLFEEDPLALRRPILDSDEVAEQKESYRDRKSAFADDFDLSLGTQLSRNKRNAEMLENLETEALMHEWGLNEKAFQYSPRVSSGGFGSPVYVPEEEPLQLPCIEEGLGPIIQTKSGGLLRSMSPLLFRNTNNGARLIVQVSAPVVLPSAMGLTLMEVLQCWASVGVEKMCVCANELMPLEDVTGKTMRQILAEAESRSNASSRLALEQESDDGDASVDENKPAEDIFSDYVPLKDLVPMAITNIEGLLVEGLKIQSGMPNQESPSSIRNQLSGELFKSFSSERATIGLDVDELVRYSLSLEEYVRLDSGEVCVKDDNFSKLLAAHCANPVEFGLTREDEAVKTLCKNGGVFAENFMMGLRVQLRDPLRNHEMVGCTMLALVQVHRIYSEIKPMFKVSKAHLAGSNFVQGNKPVWGTTRQLQSGSRWLLSSGMAKPNKNPISNSIAVVKSSSAITRKALPEYILWSISVPVQGDASTWNDHVALNVHVRNPDIIFPTESVD